MEQENLENLSDIGFLHDMRLGIVACKMLEAINLSGTFRAEELRDAAETLNHLAEEADEAGDLERITKPDPPRPSQTPVKELIGASGGRKAAVKIKRKGS